MGQRKIKDMAKLFISGLMIVWIFIKSPLNPLYQDYSYGEMFSVYYYFVFWIIVTAFVFWLIFFFKKEYFEKYKITIFTASVFLWYSYFLPLGFDVTDTGHHLSKQWRMFNGMWEAGFDATAGTNLIGGAWLKILGMPSVLWARFGFAIVQTFICLYIFRLLCIYFDHKKVFFITLSIIFSTSYMQNYLTINYDNLPFLFAVISAYFLLITYEGKAENKTRTMFLSGLFSSMAIFSKITFISVLIIPVFIIIFYSEKKKQKKIRKEILGYLSGLVFMTAVLLIFLFFAGTYSSYIVNYSRILVELLSSSKNLFQTTVTHDHSFSALYNRYFVQHLSLIKNSMYYVLVLIFFGIVYKKFKQSKFIALIFSLIFFWYSFHALFYANIGQHTPVLGGIIISFSLIAVWLMFYAEYRSNKKEIALLLAVASLYFISFVGSDLGITPVSRSGSLILLLSFSMLLIVKSKNESKIELYFLVPLLLILLWFARFVSGTHEFYPYRDTNMEMIKFSFESKPLLGIRSNYERVQVTDSLYSYLSKTKDLDKKKVFFTHNNSMGYFITGTSYVLKTPWDTLNDINKLKHNLNKKPPNIIVTSKLSHRYRLWPSFVGNKKWVLSSTYEKKSQNYYDFYEEFIDDNGYKNVYNNSFYNVYELTKDYGEKE